MMPKMRHGSTDCGMFANWIGRKIRNHQPLSELQFDTRTRSEMPNIYDGMKKKHGASDTWAIIKQAKDDETLLVMWQGSRAFTVKVNEISLEEAQAMQLVEVAA